MFFNLDFIGTYNPNESKVLFTVFSKVSRVFKINHLGKVKSSFMLDPQILTEAKLQATNERLTVSNVIEEALTEYLKRHKKGWKESFLQQLESSELKEKEKQLSSTPTFNFG